MDSERELPYGRSWLDVLLDWFERVPVPTWLMHAGVFVLLGALGPILDASLPEPPAVPNVFGAIIPALFLAITHAVRSQTATAVGRLRPVVTLSQTEEDAFAHRLVVSPPRTSLALVVLMIAWVVYAITTGSEADAFGMTQLPLTLQFVSAVGWAFGESVGMLFIVQSVRRLWFIIRVQAGSIAIDLFRQQSLYAFSMVTMSTALGFLAMAVYAPAVSGQLADPLYLWSSVVLAVLAIAIAVLPLQRIHSRLKEEKRRLGLANGTRMSRVLADLREGVDSMETAAIDAAQKALGALVTERDLVAKASTWPWAPGSFRTLATTVVMPVALLVGGRLFDAWLRGN